MATDIFNPQSKIKLSHISIHRSGIVLAVYLVVLEIIFLLIGLLIRFPLSFFITSVDTAVNLYSINTVIGVVLIVVRIALIIIIMYKWLFNYYEVWPGRIKYKSGVFFRKEREFTFVRISKVDLSQGIFGRLFNFGTINLYTPTTREWFYLSNIPDPQKNLALLRKMLINTSKIMIGDEVG